jgi:ribosomal protein S18 acetylase RimI-like enzyme
VNYRIYTPNDFADLYAIEELCFQPPFRFGRRLMRQLVDRAKAVTWIAEQDERMAGFAIVEWTRRLGGVPSDGSWSLGWMSGVAAYIQTLEVLPEQRGRGIGCQLLGCIEGSARSANAASIWLHVDEGNDRAVRLYEANGYIYQGRKEDYYALGRAALIYGKPLKLGTDH